MKMKYYLRGFGTGVLFATIIFMIGTAFHNNLASNQKKNVNSGGNIISDEESNKNNTDKNITEITTDSDKNRQSGQTTNDETTAQTVTSVSTEENTNNEDETTSKTSQNSADEDDTVMVVIKPGMVSNEVADMLEEYGVIESAYDFNTYMCDSGYESSLIVGIYELKKGASYKEIISAITR